ncbi:MAG TPA: molybdopterin-binding protein, partial [Puia sp.]|nr:molybdopterin-binding protein [Puia sp.]
MEKIVAGIITIGDELLIGQVVDTNSAWMAQELNGVGIWVTRRTAVGDIAEDIRQALDEASRRTQIILITGGLGPTADDITKPLLAEYFGGRMIVDAGALENVKHIFARLQRPMIDRNLRQAEVPDTCTVIPNRRGTAPGMWFERDNRIFVAMPGVPHEMKGMMSGEIIPRLAARFRLPFIAHRTLLLAGIGESFLAEHLASFESGLPASVRLAYLPNSGMLRLRLTIRGGDAVPSVETLDSLFSTLKQQVKDWLVTDQDIPIAEAIGRILKIQGKT